MQLDAAWMAASSGVTTVIASGKEKDGVLQVTAGVLTIHLLPCQSASAINLTIADA